MSFDLMVFDPILAPKDNKEFMNWYRVQIKWLEKHSYQDHAVTTNQLKIWFSKIVEHYPPLNGPLASDKINNYKVTDYSIGKHMIYCGFSWEAADSALKIVRELAIKHGVGFFNVSADNGEILFP